MRTSLQKKQQRLHQSEGEREGERGVVIGRNEVRVKERENWRFASYFRIRTKYFL